MISLNVEGHNEMCSGYSYSGTANFSGKTVKDVLEEIKQYAKNQSARDLGDGFGNPQDGENCNAWAIKVNNKIFKSCWAEDKPDYNGEYDNLEVDRIEVNGGWYCFYDFNIYTKEDTKIIDDKMHEDEKNEALKLYGLI